MNESKGKTKTKSRLRRFFVQFNLRTVLLTMVLTGLYTTYFSSEFIQTRENWSAVNNLLDQHSDQIVFTHQVDDNGYYRRSWRPRVPHYIYHLFGRSVRFNNVYAIDMCRVFPDAATRNPNITVQTQIKLDAANTPNLLFLSTLDQIVDLDLTGSQIVTLDGILNLKRLKSLKLANCSWLADLKPLDEMHYLETLDLSNCRGLDFEEVFQLQKQLPNTKIVFDFKSRWVPVVEFAGDEATIHTVAKKISIDNLEEVLWSTVIEKCSDIRKLNLEQCRGLTDLDKFRSLSRLEILHIENCAELMDCSALYSLPELEQVNFTGDIQLTSDDVRDLSHEFRVEIPDALRQGLTTSQKKGGSGWQDVAKLGLSTRIQRRLLDIATEVY